MQTTRDRKHKKIRMKISVTSTRPRLCVFKSNTAINVQLIDDDKAVTLVSAKGADALKVGAEIAKKAIAKKIKKVIFDRGGYVKSVRTLRGNQRNGLVNINEL